VPDVLGTAVCLLDEIAISTIEARVLDAIELDECVENPHSVRTRVYKAIAKAQHEKTLEAFKPYMNSPTEGKGAVKWVDDKEISKLLQETLDEINDSVADKNWTESHRQISLLKLFIAGCSTDKDQEIEMGITTGSNNVERNVVDIITRGGTMNILVCPCCGKEYRTYQFKAGPWIVECTNADCGLPYIGNVHEDVQPD